MNAKKSKKLLVLTSLSTLAVSTAAVLAISFSNESSKVRGLGEVVNGSVTWSVDTSSKSGSGSKISWGAQTESGTAMYLYSYGSTSPAMKRLFDSRRGSEDDNFGLTIKSVAGESGSAFKFQSITSVTVVSFQSNEGASYGIYTDSSATGTPVATQVVEANKEETNTFNVAGANYLTIKQIQTGKWLAIKSVTVTYSCEPGGQTEYLVNKTDDVGYTINPSKSSAFAGETVTFTVDAETGYTTTGVSVKRGTDNISVSETSGVYSFVMPVGDVAISATMEGLHHIDFENGCKTIYSVGDTYSLPATTAYYYGSETGVVVTEGLSATGYHLDQAGKQTVTVSYTDEAGATVSKSYDIDVLPAGSKSISYEFFDFDDDYAEVPMELIVDSEKSTIPEWSVAGELVTVEIYFMYDLVVVAAFDEYDTDYSVSEGKTITFTAPEIGSLYAGYTISILFSAI